MISDSSHRRCLRAYLKMFSAVQGRPPNGQVSPSRWMLTLPSTATLESSSRARNSSKPKRPRCKRNLSATLQRLKHPPPLFGAVPRSYTKPLRRRRHSYRVRSNASRTSCQQFPSPQQCTSDRPLLQRKYFRSGVKDYILPSAECIQPNARPLPRRTSTSSGDGVGR